MLANGSTVAVIGGETKRLLKVDTETLSFSAHNRTDTHLTNLQARYEVLDSVHTVSVPLFMKLLLEARLHCKGCVQAAHARLTKGQICHAKHSRLDSGQVEAKQSKSGNDPWTM